MNKLLLLCAIAACLDNDAACASDQDGLVNWYAAEPNSSAPYAVLMAGSRTTKPSCATDDAWAIINPASDGAKVLISGVMTAKAMGRVIQVRGSGVCDPTAPNRERVGYILFP
ncbi:MULTISPECIES: hypothetical protein [Sphingobium]|uniref:hypothetical protein n=1 Tax=Sphingobium TaxID=165695 RepID=UPI000DB23A47|nr:hypothetical protein [Sphingobium sp.]PZU62756.1 MAG: hypothetical protein DI540_25950 [Sphingobium sp.]